MFDDLLVPTDGSATAKNAVACATTLADRFDATLHVVHVLDLGQIPTGLDDVATNELSLRGKELLGHTELRAREREIETKTTLLETTGQIHDAILEYVDHNDIEFIVMGTRGHTGLDRYFLGSVTTRTLQQAPVPVMTVHEDTELDPDVDFETILVGTDGSDAARTAISYGARLAVATDAGLSLVAAVNPTGFLDESTVDIVLDELQANANEDLDEARSLAETGGAQTLETIVLQGPPGEAILEYAREIDSDTIVLGSHGREGFGRLLLGSVTEHVVRRAEMPVIVTKRETAV